MTTRPMSLVYMSMELSPGTVTPILNFPARERGVADTNEAGAFSANTRANRIESHRIGPNQIDSNRDFKPNIIQQKQT